MNNPKVISVAKKVFHGATIAAALIAAYGPLVPANYAKYVTIGSAAVSGLLHLITTLAPAAAQQ